MGTEIVTPWFDYRGVKEDGTIGMPTGRHENSDFIPGLKTKIDF